MKLLDRIEVIPYELELRDTLDAVLHRLEQLAAAATECVEKSGQLVRDRRIDHEAFRAKTQLQTRIFDNLEAFLAAYARVSLLIYPVGRTEFTRRRAATLQTCLALDSNSVLANRDLRDSWMHHDERLDQAVASGRRASGQLFKLSEEMNDSVKETFLRIIEIDTLVVHYRDRDGKSCSADLTRIRATLSQLDELRKTAFDQLSMPPDRD